MLKNRLYGKAMLAIVLVIVFIFLAFFLYSILKPRPPIKVGILHSLTGTMAISSRSVIYGELMAIDEINKSGGVLGHQIEPIVADTQSDSMQARIKAEALIVNDKVSVVFGCWTSSCRKSVKPIFEKFNHLLIYPVQYEGLEESPNIIYTGMTANQQILPALDWLFKQGRKRFFLIGSDYIYPHAANEIIREEVRRRGGQIVGEEYVLLGRRDMSKVMREIRLAKPDVIINTINGDSNRDLFSALYEAGFNSKKLPVMSFSIAEYELQRMNTKQMVGNYAVWSYFQSIPSDENKRFVNHFKDRYGKNAVTDDPIETGYFSIYLWAKAVEKAGSCDPQKVLQYVDNLDFNAPEGEIHIDVGTHHTWRQPKIGKIRSDGQFDIIWESNQLIKPIPFPSYRTREDWELFLINYHARWEGEWANPEGSN